jgi:L-rhamnose mutarotase
MRRVCFQLQVKPERIAEYRERHAEVWPDMLEALASTGWHNYSLFLRDDGLLTEVNGRWQAEMAEFFDDLGDQKPDQGFLVLEEIFHLEDQLDRARQAHDDSEEDVR